MDKQTLLAVEDRRFGPATLHIFKNPATSTFVAAFRLGNHIERSEDHPTVAAAKHTALSMLHDYMNAATAACLLELKKAEIELHQTTNAISICRAEQGS